MEERKVKEVNRAGESPSCDEPRVSTISDPYEPVGEPREATLGNHMEDPPSRQTAFQS